MALKKKMSKNYRCGLCKIYCGRRYCLRRNKDICWHCCNAMRVDLKCPGECFFILKSASDKDSRLFMQSNVYSYAELSELIKLNFDKWTLEPFSEGKQSPLLMCETEEGRKIIREFILPFIKQLPPDTGEYINKKLGLGIDLEGTAEHPENLVRNFLDHVIALEWDSAAEYLVSLTIKEQNPTLEGYDFKSNLSNILSENKALNAIEKYDFLECGFTKDENPHMIVTVEVNLKKIISFIMVQENGIWGIESIFYGDVKEYQQIEQLEKLTVDNISKNLVKVVKQNLKILSQKVILSSNLFFHTANQCLFEGEYNFALNFFHKAYTLSPNFLNTLISIANTNIELKKPGPARQALEVARLLQKDNPFTEFCFIKLDVLEGRIEKAKSDLEKFSEKFPDFVYTESLRKALKNV